MTRSHTLIAVALSTIVGCHSGTSGAGSSTTLPSTVDDSARAPNEALEVERREYSAPSLRALDKRPIVGPPPRIEILQPRSQSLVARGPAMLKLRVSRWKLAPAPGNHVHIKIDDSKEFAIRDVSKPIDLGERYEKESGKPLSEGTHVVRVFLSRPNHESVKVPSAFDSVVFHYRSKTKGWSFDGNRPMLTYSRPEGCASDPDRLLDFVVTNINGLSRKGYRVQYLIDGVHAGTLFSWSPYQIRDLSEGKHTIRLTLLRPDNSPAPGPFNDVTTSFEVSEGCRFLGLIPEDIDDEDEEVLE